MLVKRAEMVDVECVARGYLAGSGWKEYRETGSVCGIPLPAGLKESRGCPSRSSLRQPRRRAATTRTSLSSAMRATDRRGAWRRACGI